MAETYLEALHAALAADPDVAVAFPGGVYQGNAPRSADLPYCTFDESESYRQNVFGERAIDYPTVRFIAWASDSSVAKRAASTLKRRLLRSTHHEPVELVFNDGLERSRWTIGPDVTEHDPERAGYNADVWSSSFPIVFMIARG